MRRFLYDLYTITKKETIIGFRDPATTIARSVMLPLIFIIFFGFGIGNSMHEIPIGLVVQSGSSEANAFVDGLNSNNVFLIKELQYKEALQEFENNRIRAVVVIPADFKETRRAVLMNDYSIPRVAEAVSKEVAGAGASAASVNVDEEIFFGRDVRYVDFFAPSVVIMVLLFSAIFSGGLSLMYDREFGTLSSLLVAPVDKGTIILGKTLGGVLQTMVSVFSALMIVLILGIKIHLNPLNLVGFFAMSFIAGLGFIGMSVAIACKVKRLEQLLTAMLVINFPLWLLSGAIYPVESMPHWMGALSQFNPLTYLLDAFRLLLTRNIVMPSLELDLLVISAYAVLMYLAGVIMFKKTIG